MWHYRPEDGYFGDPIPFYWQGVYHIFYLKAPLEPKRHGADFTYYAHVSTKDFLTWTEHPAVIHPDAGGPDSKSCWTGCVFHHDGVFYLFYTGHDSGHPTRPQSICLATSRDMEHWEKSSRNPILLPDTNRFKISDWRDPFVFWSEEDQCFMMSITTMMKGADFYTAGALVYARSQDLQDWEIGDVYYNPGNHGYPECSDIFEMGGRYYVLMSIFHKTAYRFAPTIHGPWQTGRTDSFDGVMNYAAKSLGEGDKRFVIGWIRTRKDRRDSGNWEWAGHMAFPREIVQDTDGTLYSRLPEQFSALRGEEIYSLGNGGVAVPAYGTWEAGARGVHRLLSSPLYGELKLEATAPTFDLELEFTLDPGTRSGGLIFGANDTNHPGYEVCVDLRLQQLLIRKHGQRFGCYACQDIHALPDEVLRLRVIVEEDIVEAFLNDRYALASRCYQVGANPPLSFFIEEGGGVLSRAHVCALAEKPALALAVRG